ncbi:MAG TPA: NrfD/PsrC family molybdoenzyme membrane anchor subunit [Longimicrobiales bacterium]
MSSVTDRYPDLPARRLEVVPAMVRVGAPILAVLGVLILAVAFAVDKERAWRAYHFNWLFFTSIAQGAVTLAVVVTITRGVWSRPIRRLALSFAAFLPVAWLLAIPILFGAEHIFPWVADPNAIQPGKDAYLNVPFMSIRILGLLGLLIFFDLKFAYWALRPDLGLIRDTVPQSLQPLYARMTRDWRGQDAEEAVAAKKLGVLGPVIAALFAVAFGVVAWDFVMSLEPHWFSTMIGPYFFMGGFLGGVAATVVLCVLYVLRGNARHVIEPVNLHDIGKLMFGFCVFWAYLFYSQFIVIWYGLLPIEQAWLVHRFGMPFQPLMALVFACLFVFPFFGLMGVAPKRTPQILVFFAGIVLIGLWLERYMLVYPSLYSGADNIPFGWQEFGPLLFFAGLIVMACAAFQARFPVFQIWQPPSELELLGVEPIESQVTAPMDDEIL